MMSESDQAVWEKLSLKELTNSRGDVVYLDHRGMKHRKFGPAFITRTGTRGWYWDNLLHRLDGPALEWYDGNVDYYIRGNRVSETTFHHLVADMKHD